MTLRLVRRPPADDDGFGPEATVFQSRAWLDFLAESQGCRPVVADVLDGDRIVGRFTGATVRRLGVPLLGSPLPGWTTSYLGFDLALGVDRVEAADALAGHAFGPLGCWHVELLDRWLTAPQARDAGYVVDDDRWLHGYELPLDTGADLFAGLSSSARWGVRRAGRHGVRVSAVDVGDGGERGRFVADYHGQLTEVFARRGRRVPYGPDRVDALLRHVGATGNVLALRATVDGDCVATGVFPFDARAAYFWGGASSGEGRRVLANDALLWAAIDRARASGQRVFDFGGGGSFKAKFGGSALDVAWVRRSRWPVVEAARRLVGRRLR